MTAPAPPNPSAESTQDISGSGLLALGPVEDLEIARDLANALIPPVPLMPSVPESLRVTRDELLGWAQAGGSEQALPRFVEAVSGRGVGRVIVHAR